MREIRHRGCGGLVRPVPRTTYHECAVCSRSWTSYEIAQMPPIEHGVNFYSYTPAKPIDLQPWPSYEETMVLVEDEVDGKRFTKSVPETQAWRYRRANLGA